MICELRQYTCAPGKLPRVLRRFEEEAFPIWAEIGIRSLGFWTSTTDEGDEMLHYMLAWENPSDRELKWTAFAGDPRWRRARETSEVDGPLVLEIRSSMLEPAL